MTLEPHLDKAYRAKNNCDWTRATNIVQQSHALVFKSKGVPSRDAACEREFGDSEIRHSGASLPPALAGQAERGKKPLLANGLDGDAPGRDLKVLLAKAS